MITIAVSLLLTYCLVITILFGVQPSISETFYRTGQRAYFSVTMIAVAFLLTAGVTPNGYFIAASCCLAVIGVAADFKVNHWMAKGVHYAFVFISIGLFITGFTLIKWEVGVAAFMAMGLAAYILRNVKNSTWWQELAAVLIIYFTLLILKI